MDVCGPVIFLELNLTSTFRTAFDPQPFIRTFEAAVDKLIAVRKDVQTKTEQMEKSVRVAEREYSKRMAELNRGFEVCGRQLYQCLIYGDLRQLGTPSLVWKLE
jgi:hypothetical protein